MVPDRRHPLRPFQRDLIRDFLRGRQVMDATLLPGGKSNSNYRLTLSDGTRCVLRLHAQASPERERYAMDLARDIVPVPQLLWRGDGWSILSFVDGKPFAECPQHTREVARQLARISSIHLPGPGWIEPNGSITPFEFEAEGGFNDLMFRHPDVQCWLGMDAIDALRRKLAALPQPPPSPVRLCHGDYNPTNILLRDGVVTGILDWEFAHAATYWGDIGNLLRHTPSGHEHLIAEGFADAGMPLPDDWQRRARLADLGSHLEFLTSARAEAFKRHCVTWIEAFAASLPG